MSERANQLLAEILALPREERWEVTRQLLEREQEEIPELPESDESEEEAEARWREELDRRLASIADGTAELIPWEKARAEIAAELERRRAARARGETP